MIDVTILKLVGFSAVAALVVGWLATSFLPAGAGRMRVARASSIALYLALLALFTNLVQNAWGAGRTALLIPFGFLWVIFVSGFVVSLVKWLSELRHAPGAGTHATH